jgi:hypothetical protein
MFAGLYRIGDLFETVAYSDTGTMTSFTVIFFMFNLFFCARGISMAISEIIG